MTTLTLTTIRNTRLQFLSALSDHYLSTGAVQPSRLTTPRVEKSETRNTAQGN
jgi:hypothetical protein